MKEVGLMAKAKKKRFPWYAFFLTLFIIAIFSAAYYALGKVWDYAEEYERSQPGPVIDAYIDNLNKTLWDDSLQQTVASMRHDMQTDEECAEVVKKLLSSGITYAKSAESTDTYLVYTLRCESGKFGKVMLDLDKSVESEYDLYPWKVCGEEFDFSGLYSSVQVTIPASYSVTINGHTLGPDFIIEEGIHYDVLEKYYDYYDKLPTKVTYRFDYIIGSIMPVIYDYNGNETVILSDSDDSQYITEVEWDKFERLQYFSNTFAERYFDYITGMYDPTYGYQRLMPYIVVGSDFDKELLAAMDGIYWSHTSSCKVNSNVLNSVIYLGDNLYLCNITTNTTIVDPHGTITEDQNMELIVVENGGDCRVVMRELC